MKSNYVILTSVLLFFMFTATAQQGINYKAIINDANGNILANTAVAVQFTILEKGTTEVYKESHSPTTDGNGIIVVNIAEGTTIIGDFSTIAWGSNPHFLKTEIDAGDGLTDMGTTEFKAVPYALHAENAESVSGPITETQNLSEVLAIDNSANSQIKNVTDPTETQDAATKSYVDQLQYRIEQLENSISLYDYDEDGYTVFQDCNDNNAAVYPGAHEICDGLDNDCNEVVDDVLDAPHAILQSGVCVGSRQVCNGPFGWVEPDYSTIESYEFSETLCDGLDNDCDGDIDESCNIINIIPIEQIEYCGCGGMAGCPDFEFTIECESDGIRFIDTPSVYLRKSDTTLQLEIDNVSFISDTELNLTIPVTGISGLELGEIYDIVVINSDGTSGELLEAFKVCPIPPP